MPKRTRAYHEFLLEELRDPVFAAEYLNEARQDSKKIFLKALRNVAEARRMAVVAADAGVNRESLYKSLSEDGNPRLETYDSVLSALGIDYEFRPKEAAKSTPALPQTQKANAVRTAANVASSANGFACALTMTYVGNIAASTAGQIDEQVSDIPSVPLFLLGQMSEQQEAMEQS